MCLVDIFSFVLLLLLAIFAVFLPAQLFPGSSRHCVEFGSLDTPGENTMLILFSTFFTVWSLHCDP